MKKSYDNASNSPAAIEAARERGREEMAAAQATKARDRQHRQQNGLQQPDATRVKTLATLKAPLTDWAAKGWV